MAAGEYDAVAVEGGFFIADTDTTVRYWFADGVGIVKWQYAIAGTESTPLGLKKYTPGQAEKSK